MEIDQKISGIAYEAARSDSEYTKHMHRAISLGRKIMEYLGPYRALFLEYEISAGLSENIYLRNAYKTGMEDGQQRTRNCISCPTKCPTKT